MENKWAKKLWKKDKREKWWNVVVTYCDEELMELGKIAICLENVEKVEGQLNRLLIIIS